MPVSPTDPIVTLAASQTGLPPAVVAAQINVESGGNPDAVSPAGAEGEFQFLPSTYTGLGFPAGTEFDPAVEVRAYEKYMTQLLQWAKGDVRQALAAYNAGQGNWQAGLGYADTILANAKTGQGLTVGTHQQPSSAGLGPLGGLVGDVSGLLGLPFKWAGSITSDIANAVLTAAAPLVKIAEAIDWFFHPAHWIRLFAGIAGGVLVLVGVWQMSHAGGA
jgi:Transglycosylase SLT domain